MRMSLGEKVSVVCPFEMAYGENGNGMNIPPKANLAFEIDLLCIANNCAANANAIHINHNNTNSTMNTTITNPNSGNYLRFDCFDFFKIGLFLISLIFV